MNINLIFFLKNKILKNNTNLIIKAKYISRYSLTQFNPFFQIKFFKKSIVSTTNRSLSKYFLKKSISLLKNPKFSKIRKKINLFFFLNKFFLNFLETFFKSKLLINIKKGTNNLSKLVKFSNIDNELNTYYSRLILVSKKKRPEGRRIPETKFKLK